MLFLITQEEAYWFHKAESKWLQLGNKNTRFFQQSTLAWRRRNTITALKNTEGSWVYEEEGVKAIVTSFLLEPLLFHWFDFFLFYYS